MNQKERMLAGLPYKAWLDGLEEERLLCKKRIFSAQPTFSGVSRAHPGSFERTAWQNRRQCYDRAAVSLRLWLEH